MDDIGEGNPARDYRRDPAARQAEWFRYYSEKRIVHQWLQVHLLKGLAVGRVLEVGPGLGLVSALLDHAGYRVTTLDRLPAQYDNSRIDHIQADLASVAPERIAGFDAILCCETLEHFAWAEVDGLFDKFRRAAPRYLLTSVPYMGAQLDLRLYLSCWRARRAFSLKLPRGLRRFRPDGDPLGHKWEVGYRDTSLAALEAKLVAAGFRLLRREFTGQTRSVFHLCEPARDNTTA
jgi:SAM-dependent methyltransferase